MHATTYVVGDTSWKRHRDIEDEDPELPLLPIKL